MKPYIGKCRICGKETKLTFEHIPPSTANNRYPIKALINDSFVDLITSDLRFP